MRLPDWLKSRHLTQAEFGRLLDPPMTQAGLSHVINGRIRISLERALEIEEVTGGAVTVRDWLVQKEERAPSGEQSPEPNSQDDSLGDGQAALALPPPADYPGPDRRQTGASGRRDTNHKGAA